MKLCMMSSITGFDAPYEVVDIARYCRMEAVDWILPADREMDPDFYRKLCVDNGLKTAAYTSLFNACVDGRENWKDLFKKELAKACGMEAPVMMIPPVASADQKSLADDRARWLEFYSWAAPEARSCGVCLTLEPTGMLNSPVATAAEISELLDAVPDLRLTMDYGNMATAGEAPEAVGAFAGKIAHIHLKDWLISDVEIPNSRLKRCGRYFANAMIGTGMLDVKRSWDALSAADKECYVNLETADFTWKLSIKEALKQVSDCLRHW